MVKSLVVQMERDLPAETTMANPYINPFAENDLMVNPPYWMQSYCDSRLFGIYRKIYIQAPFFLTWP